MNFVNLKSENEMRLNFIINNSNSTTGFPGIRSQENT